MGGEGLGGILEWVGALQCRPFLNIRLPVSGDQMCRGGAQGVGGSGRPLCLMGERWITAKRPSRRLEFPSPCCAGDIQSRTHTEPIVFNKTCLSGLATSAAALAYWTL